MEGIPVVLILVVLFGLYILTTSIRILQEYERAVIFRLGRLAGRGVKGPGLILLIPIVDKMVKVSLRTVVLDVTPRM
jgi:regulator of protease activity HflC (stomatin/prohibitin superfamily)